MAAKKNAVNKSTQARVRGTPNYPYLYAPAAMNRFLKEIPKKPKPDFVDPALFKAWGFLNAADSKIASVLETLEFLDASRRPTQKYEAYMQLGKGPAVLGREIRRVYDALFKTVKNPSSASQDELRSFLIRMVGAEKKQFCFRYRLLRTWHKMPRSAMRTHLHLRKRRKAEVHQIMELPLERTVPPYTLTFIYIYLKKKRKRTMTQFWKVSLGIFTAKAHEHK